MKKLIPLLLICLISLSLFGCSNKITSSTDLIYDPKMIDYVSLDVVKGNKTSVYYEFSDLKQVKSVVELLKGIELKQLSLEQEREIFKDPEAWSQKVSFMISLIATTERDTEMPYKGHITILDDGRLFFSDPKTMGPFKDDEIERTDSYISSSKHKDTIKKIFTLIDEAIANTAAKEKPPN